MAPIMETGHAKNMARSTAE